MASHRSYFILALSLFSLAALIHVASAGKVSRRVRSVLSECDSQTPLKVWVFFNSKYGPSENARHSKRALQEIVSETLHEKAIQRRLKMQRQTGATVFSESDLPVSHDLVASLQNLNQDIKIRTKSKWLNAVSIQVPGCSEDLIHQISQLPFVESIQVVSSGKRALPTATEPTDSATRRSTEAVMDYGKATAFLSMMQVPELHNLGLTGENITIAILDTGFDISHPAVANAKIQAMYDFVRNDSNPQLEAGEDPAITFHGTAVLGTMGGALPGELWGPAYNATFLLARTEDYLYEYIDEEDYFVAGVEWAEANGADILSASLSYLDWVPWEEMDGETTITDRGIKPAIERGLFVVVAAGNTGDRMGTPAGSKDVLTVGAVFADGNLVRFSSRGPTFDGRIKPEVLAPGVRIYVAKAPNLFAYSNGTSYSAPYVAGVAALLLQAHPDWTNLQLKEALMKTALNRTTPDVNRGWGIVQGLAALNYTFSSCSASNCISGTCQNGACRCSPGFYGYQYRCQDWCGVPGIMEYGYCNSTGACICSSVTGFPRCSLAPVVVPTAQNPSRSTFQPTSNTHHREHTLTSSILILLALFCALN